MLVGNYGQPSAGRRHTSTKIAQDFTTGSNALGYTLDGVDIRTLDYNPFRMSVHILTSDGGPGRSIATLTPPPVFEVGRRLRFEAPSGTNLDADTTYAVVISDFSRAYAGRARLDSTRSNAQDSSSLQGWSIEDQFRQWIAGGADVDGAVSSNYTLTGDEEGKTIKVRVSLTDDEGNAESLTRSPLGSRARALGSVSKYIPSAKWKERKRVPVRSTPFESRRTGSRTPVTTGVSDQLNIWQTSGVGSCTLGSFFRCSQGATEVLPVISVIGRLQSSSALGSGIG